MDQAHAVDENLNAVVASNWNTGLYDCFKDCSFCCWVSFCTPCIYGQIVSLFETGKTGGCFGDFGSCCLIWCLISLKLGCFIPLITNKTRTKIRQRYGLPEEPKSDCKTHCCCLDCALGQEWKELMIRNELLPVPTAASASQQQVPVQQPVAQAVVTSENMIR
eukprot:c4838_g1_i1.p1 GENE.c4838_g1_i1~~c4838_g1_i1.p1  ORF type:complete len:187 (-),score=31.44 c4838_g1_i1:127-615(-)